MKDIHTITITIVITIQEFLEHIILLSQSHVSRFHLLSILSTTNSLSVPSIKFSVSYPLLLPKLPPFTIYSLPIPSQKEKFILIII